MIIEASIGAFTTTANKIYNHWPLMKNEILQLPVLFSINHTIIFSKRLLFIKTTESTNKEHKF